MSSHPPPYYRSIKDEPDQRKRITLGQMSRAIKHPRKIPIYSRLKKILTKHTRDSRYPNKYAACFLNDSIYSGSTNEHITFLYLEGIHIKIGFNDRTGELNVKVISEKDLEQARRELRNIISPNKDDEKEKEAATIRRREAVINELIELSRGASPTKDIEAILHAPAEDGDENIYDTYFAEMHEVIQTNDVVYAFVLLNNEYTLVIRGGDTMNKNYEIVDNKTANEIKVEASKRAAID